MSRVKKSARTEHVGVRIEPALRRALEDAAGEDRRSMADVVRLVLSDWLAGRVHGARARPPGGIPGPEAA
jgi:hypothetical protein